MGPEALWSIEFVDNKEHHGGGIAVFQNKRVLGGNNGFTYIGSYAMHGPEILINVHIKRFNDEVPGIYKDEFDITFKGRYHDLEFIVTGSPSDNPEFILAAQCTRQGEVD